MLLAEVQSLKDTITDSDDGSDNGDNNNGDPSVEDSESDDDSTKETKVEVVEKVTETKTEPSETKPITKGGETLPDTATNSFNFLLLGMLLLIVGGSIGSVVYFRKRKNVTDN
ncbi:LPXTG cell wall anchor domain-containing protein [Salipaludibacillus sp. HK11]|uniref:LPXTG cell wall anchor domain-containing protein n=1 Tax=Salipaludibacillus sp. HK11 TaxID=3394320 RepID=UPI0039FC6BA9